MRDSGRNLARGLESFNPSRGVIKAMDKLIVCCSVAESLLSGQESVCRHSRLSDWAQARRAGIVGAFEDQESQRLLSSCCESDFEGEKANGMSRKGVVLHFGASLSLAVRRGSVAVNHRP